MLKTQVYLVKVPPTKEQGSYISTAHSSPTKTMEQNALWQYNGARAHDGLPPLKCMPKGTKYIRQELL